MLTLKKPEIQCVPPPACISPVGFSSHSFNRPLPAEFIESLVDALGANAVVQTLMSVTLCLDLDFCNSQSISIFATSS
jgi:hypothetical protein